MRIAKFKSLGEYSFESIQDNTLEDIADYVRISEYVDVEFPPLQSDEVVQKQLDALDRAESALRSKFQSALGSIEQQRAELRAITYTQAPIELPTECPKCGPSCQCDIAWNE